jgi:quercetin dioxygenase-like cupin family protein
LGENGKKPSNEDNFSEGGRGMEKFKIVQQNDVRWEPHPQLARAEVGYLVSNRDENMDLTCMLVHLPPGTQVDRHTHECDDIIYVVKGKATMWIEGVGDVEMVQGTFLRIPKGVAHQPYNIEEDFIAYDVFYPFLA